MSDRAGTESIWFGLGCVQQSPQATTAPPEVKPTMDCSPVAAATISVRFGEVFVRPVLSKTDWLNRSIGLPPVSYEIEPRPEGGSTVMARARLLGLEMRWQEFPFEWLEPEFYHVHRIFESGPFTEATMGIDFMEESN